MNIEDVLAQSIVTPDERDGRVYGWIPGVVTDIDTKLMRVKARIGKQEDGDSTDWLVPMGMGSVESLPETGDPIGVMFADGDPHRGAYFYFPQSTTRNRPGQPAMLGEMFIGIFNYLVTQYNQLRTDFDTFVTVKYNLHNHPTAPVGPVSVPSVTGTATTAAVANKGKASDGSVVADKATSEIVLSKRTKVR